MRRYFYPGLKSYFILPVRLGAILFFMLSILFPINLKAQSIVVKPYLQNLSDTELIVMFETDLPTLGVIKYALDSLQLDNQIQSEAQQGNGNSRIHTASITGLTPGTRYYYQVELENGITSQIYHFSTLFSSESKQHINLLLISDTQHQSGRPYVLRDMVTNGFLPVIQQEIEGGLDSLHGIIVAGDLVTTGSTYSQWKNYFFDHLEPMAPYVPIYPALGNHDYWTGGNGLANYLKYFDLPLNGHQYYPEQWWYKDFSNVRMITLDSEINAAGKNLQLTWLSELLDSTCAASAIDFVLLQLHHPYKSELWTPGESQFAGQVIALLDDFEMNCTQQVAHIFGHTHGYSRGQSKENRHIWMNVATGGGAIDYWGEWPQQDYDEFVHSEDDYGFVLTQVKTGVDASLTMKRFSMGDDNHPLFGELIDYIVLRKNNPPITTPQAIFPFGSQPFQCVEFKASQFNHPYDFHQASLWQISETENFENPVIEFWKQHKNIYFNEDLQAGQDLTELSVTSLQPNTQYYWRVKFRDQHLNWSDWSNSLEFVTISGNITGNLLQNPSAENGIDHWTGDIESLTNNQCGSVPVFQGSRFFAVGGVCDNQKTVGLAQQIINVVEYLEEIDAGGLVAQYGGHLRTWAINNDLPQVYLRFYDGAGLLLDSTNVLSNNLPEWTYVADNAFIPVGTRRIVFVLKGTRLSGTDNDSYFDELFFKLVNVVPCLSCFGHSGVDYDGDGFCSDIDCNDNNPHVYPGALEICDGIDNNCDGFSDTGETVSWTGSSGNLFWEDPQNWEQQFIPLSCQNVVIETGMAELNTWQKVKSVFIGTNAELILESDSFLDISSDSSFPAYGLYINGNMTNYAHVRVKNTNLSAIKIEGLLTNIGKIQVLNAGSPQIRILPTGSFVNSGTLHVQE
jgi:acid phosphatase type 7